MGNLSDAYSAYPSRSVFSKGDTSCAKAAGISVHASIRLSVSLHFAVTSSLDSFAVLFLIDGFVHLPFVSKGNV